MTNHPTPPTFGVHWTCAVHGDACEKSGLDWDCSDESERKIR